MTPIQTPLPTKVTFLGVEGEDFGGIIKSTGRLSTLCRELRGILATFDVQHGRAERVDVAIVGK